jgi:hypothetical protein
MTWETAGIFAEVIASIAVIVSLWYLAVQLKQNTELARGELEVQLGITWAELHDNMIQNPSLARAYDLAAKDWDAMSEEDVRAYLWFVAKSFHILQGMYRQYRRGLLAEEVWSPYEGFIVGALQIDAVLGWWQCEGLLASNEFKNHVEELLRSSDGVQWRPVSTADMTPNQE